MNGTFISKVTSPETAELGKYNENMTREIIKRIKGINS